MADTLAAKYSPLAAFSLPVLDRAGADDTLVLAEMPGRSHINIRLHADDRRAVSALKRATSLALPKPGTYAADDDAYLAWLSPDEFLLVSDVSDSAGLLKEVSNKLSKVNHALNDVSSGQTIVRVAGARAAWVLAKGCTLDLHDEVFVPPMCAQTRIAKTQTFLRIAGPQTFDVVVRRSFADYFFRWLSNAAADSSPVVGSL